MDESGSRDTSHLLWYMLVDQLYDTPLHTCIVKPLVDGLSSYYSIIQYDMCMQIIFEGRLSLS